MSSVVLSCTSRAQSDDCGDTLMTAPSSQGSPSSTAELLRRSPSSEHGSRLQADRPPSSEQLADEGKSGDKGAGGGIWKMARELRRSIRHRLSDAKPRYSN